MKRLRGDAGQVGGIEAVPFGLLVLLVGILVLAHTWAVVDAKFVTAGTAREATRAFVEAADEVEADAAVDGLSGSADLRAMPTRPVRRPDGRAGLRPAVATRAPDRHRAIGPSGAGRPVPGRPARRRRL